MGKLRAERFEEVRAALLQRAKATFFERGCRYVGGCVHVAQPKQQDQDGEARGQAQPVARTHARGQRLASGMHDLAELAGPAGANLLCQGLGARLRVGAYQRLPSRPRGTVDCTSTVSIGNSMPTPRPHMPSSALNSR
jgi:hypothetical protein